jgi:hypothetical protein
VYLHQLASLLSDRLEQFIRSSSISKTSLLSDTIKVEVGLVHGLFVVLEAEFDVVCVVDLNGGSFFGSHDELIEVDRVSANGVERDMNRKG